MGSECVPIVSNHNKEEYQNIPNCSGYQAYSDREKIFLTQATQGGIQDPFAAPPDTLEKDS